MKRAALSLLTIISIALGAACVNSSSNKRESEATELIRQRTGKSRAEHDEFARFALFDADGDGKLSAPERQRAREAGLDVDSLASIHKR